MKTKKFFFYLCCAATLTFSTACSSGDSGSQDPIQEDPIKPDNPDDKNNGGGDGGETAELTVAEQQAKLDNTARELLQQISASDFDEVRNLANYFRSHYTGSNYNTDAIGNWWQGCVEDITTVVSDTRASTYYTDYERLWAASNFTGHFQATADKWVYAPASDLQFSFTDASGANCVARLTTSGNTYRVHHSKFDSENADWNYDGDNWYKYVKTYRNVVVVPENLNIVFTKGGTEILSATMHTTISTGADIDLAFDSYNIALTTKVGGYEVVVSKANLSQGKTASASVVMNKNGVRLFNAAVNAAGHINTDNKVERIDNCAFSADVLGKVQVKGECQNGSQLINNIKKARTSNEAESKARVEQANSLLNAALYFDGNNNRSSTLKLIAIEDETYYGYSEWRAQPAIAFSDGTIYAFGDFFTRDRFRTVINMFTDLVDDFKGIIESVKN